MHGFAIVLVILGIWFVISALANWEWYKAIWDMAAIETIFGEDVARVVFLIAGIICAVVGIVMLTNPTQ